MNEFMCDFIRCWASVLGACLSCWQRPAALPFALLRPFHPGHVTRSLRLQPTSTSSPNFGTIFAIALREYKKQARKDIASNPLAAERSPATLPIPATELDQSASQSPLPVIVSYIVIGLQNTQSIKA
jgi:hypothetical protein